MEKSRKMLMHVCCGPCATASIERLIDEGWKVDLFYCNSNIATEEEYLKRLEGVQKVSDYFGIEWFEDKYSHESWRQAVKGLEKEPEKGCRCSVCFGYSLKKTSEWAQNGDYDGFCTSLTVSPHKNSPIIFKEGLLAAERAGNRTRFIEYDFKKKDGYKRSIELAKQIGLYRQNYCGCEFSMR